MQIDVYNGATLIPSSDYRVMYINGKRLVIRGAATRTVKIWLKFKKDATLGAKRIVATPHYSDVPNTIFGEGASKDITVTLM
jgi:hypothetical protein